MQEDEKKPLILIVDDTPTNIKMLVETLKGEYDLAFATNGKEAIEYVIENLPDLILLDIMMPEMDGYEVCSRLKEDERSQNIPVIFITALNEITDKTKGFEIGAADYITKPFEVAEVKARVKTQLSLKQMIEKLEKQNKLIEEVFGRYVDKDVAEQILQGKVSTEGEMKDLTALFVDIQGFTAYAERHHPSEVLKKMNDYFSVMTETIEKHGGKVMQYIGDEIFAIFGAPIALASHPDKAVEAAIEMREVLNSLNLNWVMEEEEQFKQSIGIHTGKAVAGIVGSKERQSYILIGDAINQASRIAGLCNVFDSDILISEDTSLRLTQAIEMQMQEPVQIKGKMTKIVVYKVL